MRLDDDLKADDRIIVDGPRRGDIQAALVQIEKGGSVVGNISARVVKVAGRLEGDVDAAEFYAAKTARVRGAIRADVVGIMPGASVAGCSFGTSLPSLVEKASPISASNEVVPEHQEEVQTRPDLSVALARLAEQLAEVVAGTREEPKPVDHEATIEADEPTPALQDSTPSPAAQKRVLPKLFA